MRKKTALQQVLLIGLLVVWIPASPLWFLPESIYGPATVREGE